MTTTHPPTSAASRHVTLPEQSPPGAPKRLLLVKCGRASLGGVVPPLGLLYITAALRKHHPGVFDIRLIHTGLEDEPLPTVERMLREFRPDFVGLSALTCEVSVMRSVARAARAVGATVVAGGPHASGVPAEVRTRAAWPAPRGARTTAPSR